MILHSKNLLLQIKQKNMFLFTWKQKDKGLIRKFNVARKKETSFIWNDPITSNETIGLFPKWGRQVFRFLFHLQQLIFSVWRSEFKQEYFLETPLVWHATMDICNTVGKRNYFTGYGILLHEPPVVVVLFTKSNNNEETRIPYFTRYFVNPYSVLHNRS